MTRTTTTTTTSPATGRRMPAAPAGDAAERRSSRRGLFAAPTVPALLALALPSLTSAQPSTPDAALLDLERRFEAAWTVETAAWTAIPYNEDRADQLNDATGVLADQIEDMPATTLAGLLVKARVLHWTRAETPLDASLFDYEAPKGAPGATSAERLILSMLADLHALATGAAA